MPPKCDGKRSRTARTRRTSNPKRLFAPVCEYLQGFKLEKRPFDEDDDGSCNTLSCNATRSSNATRSCNVARLYNSNVTRGYTQQVIDYLTKRQALINEDVIAEATMLAVYRAFTPWRSDAGEISSAFRLRHATSAWLYASELYNEWLVYQRDFLEACAMERRERERGWPFCVPNSACTSFDSFPPFFVPSA
jgi:hypothetical protein